MKPARTPPGAGSPAAAALLACLVAAPALSAELVSPVAGVFSLSSQSRDRWGWSGAWRFPVGDARDYTAPGPSGEPGYRLLRTIGGIEEGTRLHQGADLGNSRNGWPVRAAAAGMVLAADRRGWNSGYGHHVVLGHRLPGGKLAYSVYAHLAEGSIVVRPGQMVAAGARLGRVGRTGRATTPHLHFEIRMAASSDRRWENEDFVDPIEFVAARLAAPCEPDTFGRYLEWAQYAGLIEGAVGPATPLRREHWWRMLAFATRQGLDTLPGDASALAESLVSAGVLPEGPGPRPGADLDWADIARDLARIREIGLRLPARPLEDPGHRAACESVLGHRSPARALERGGEARRGEPTVAAALIAVADLAPALEKPKPPRRKRRPPAAASPGPVRPDSSRAEGRANRP